MNAMNTMRRKMKKIGTGIAGGFVTLLGIVLIPYPGPGWLVVFAGLAILSTEFVWAKKLLDKVKGYYEKWQQWLKKQPMFVRILVLAATGLIVLVTMWFLNVFGLIDKLFHLNLTWVHSPFIK